MNAASQLPSGVLTVTSVSESGRSAALATGAPATAANPAANDTASNSLRETAVIHDGKQPSLELPRLTSSLRSHLSPSLNRPSQFEIAITISLNELEVEPESRRARAPATATQLRGEHSRGRQRRRYAVRHRHRRHDPDRWTGANIFAFPNAMGHDEVTNAHLRPLGNPSIQLSRNMLWTTDSMKVVISGDSSWLSASYIGRVCR
jgi:hypothetical protein